MMAAERTTLATSIGAISRESLLPISSRTTAASQIAKLVDIQRRKIVVVFGIVHAATIP